MKNTDAFTLENSGKQSWFGNHCKLLLANHPFRKNKRAIRRNKMITNGPLEVTPGEDILNHMKALDLVKVTEENDDTNKYIFNRSRNGRK